MSRIRRINRKNSTNRAIFIAEDAKKKVKHSMSITKRDNIVVGVPQPSKRRGRPRKVISKNKERAIRSWKDSV